MTWRLDLDKHAIPILLALSAVVLLGAVLPSYLRMRRFKNMPPPIAKVVVDDRKGTVQVFNVASWEERRQNYTRFKTPEGHTVEIVEDKVIVK